MKILYFLLLKALKWLRWCAQNQMSVGVGRLL